MVGKIYQTNNCGELEVMEYVGKDVYRVRFSATGAEVNTNARQIREGSVKDRLHPSVAGVGYLGNATTTSNPKLYARWKRMIQSCYDQYHLDYHSNGEAGVRVADKWHSYENYEKDISELLLQSGKPERFRIIRNGTNFSKETVLIIG